jgi:hypothetical protein
MMRTTARRLIVGVSLVAIAIGPMALSAGPAAAHAPSGAIFTTLADGSEVNFNHYAAKEDVYLDGGPGPGAPQEAAGLDDGTYVFQVTNPSGRDLLSTDLARCRQFTVANGIITGVVATGCGHVTGLDVDHGATTVQLFPFLDTTNPGGVYKVWVTFLADFLAGCEALGVPNGLDVVNCGRAPGNLHGFVPSHSKTDNFKVGEEEIIEIDTRFFGPGSSTPMDGLGVTWHDPLGASNKKWSYWAPQLMVFHEAHVEAVETGTHLITVADQPGCTIDHIHANGQTFNGPATVAVKIKSLSKDLTVFIDVECE